MLIHKTMRMPKSCLSCWIAPTCEVWVREKSKYKGYDNRLENCPLEEVKHGHWINTSISANDHEYSYEAECDLCGARVHNNFSSVINYCPRCGAKMDEDRDYEHAVEQLEHDMTFEPTYNPEDGSM